mgnify:CR=1 FL=1
MMMVLYLSPGIIKRNNLEVREKVWKVSDISQQPFISIAPESKEEKQAEIVEVYWMMQRVLVELKNCLKVE